MRASITGGILTYSNYLFLETTVSNQKRRACRGTAGHVRNAFGGLEAKNELSFNQCIPNYSHANQKQRLQRFTLSDQPVKRMMRTVDPQKQIRIEGQLQPPSVVEFHEAPKSESYHIVRLIT